MARYADDSKERVREAVDMVDLVSSRTELRRAGPGRYMGRCPFHDERTASFSVDAERKLYHCFGCGVGGDPFNFVRETEGLDFVGALEALAGRYGVELEVADEDPAAAERRRHRERLLELLERAAGFYVRYLWDSTEAEPARAYLAERGLGEEVLRAYRVGYAPSAWDTLLMAGRQQGFSNREIFDAGLAVRAKGEGRIYDRFRRRIMFPLTDARGRVLGFGARALGADQQPKYLNSADGEVYHKGEHLFGTDLARVHATRADEVVVAEGYTDVLMLHQAGVRNTVGLMGTALTEKQVGELAKLGSRVLLALDADSAGQEAMLRAAKLAQGRKLELRVVPLPAGADPAEVVARDGPEAAAQLVGSSVPFVRFRVERELAEGDLGSAEGKDRVIDELRPVFATLAPSAMREELLAMVADRMDLAPALVSSWLPAPGEGRGPNGNGGGAGSRRAEPAPSARVTADPAALAERALLAQCLANGEAGREALEALPADAFTDAMNRRVADHLRAHFEAPEKALPGEDEDPDGRLASLITRLLANAAQQPPSRSSLRSQLARVELVHLDRRIGEAKAARAGGVAELVAHRARVEERLNDALAEAIDEQRPEQ